MSRVCRVLIRMSWALGLLSMTGGVVLKVVPPWSDTLRTSPRAGLIFAGVLFLCALATREMVQASSPDA